jgi:folylpolyglutamate synthase/dihydropteroate synthase
VREALDQASLDHEVRWEGRYTRLAPRVLWAFDQAHSSLAGEPSAQVIVPAQAIGEYRYSTEAMRA